MGCNRARFVRGSGSLGIECLSRGAKFVHFNDISPASIAVLTRIFTVCAAKSTPLPRATGCPACAASNKNSIWRSSTALCRRLRHTRDRGACLAQTRIQRRNDCIRARPRVYGYDSGLDVTDERKYGKTYLTFFQPNTVN